MRDATLALLSAALLCGLLAAGPWSAGSVGPAIATGVGVVGVAAAALLTRPGRRVGPADRVTLARTVLVGGCATITVLTLTGGMGPRPWWLIALALPALVLDGVDGHVARRTGTSSPAGARFDMEVDAALILVLSVAVAGTVGPWVLLIGAARYLWIGASAVVPRLRRRPRIRLSRRVIAVVQAGALLVALVPPVPLAAATVGLVVALGALLFSFGRDLRELLGAPRRRS
ncbi:CDP-alcohol phosphatidyltransferase family protein [Kineococcus gynurae]|uniref:CDP-alcohol phosphatidyltransferase family protein n=1 Tax=Kineococcus gynurae TaxID=452979 RepID=UPI003D7E5C39